MRGVVAAGLVAVAAVAWAADETSWRDHFTLNASLRVRGEFVDWFQPFPGAAPDGAERYAFFASRLRAGIRAVFPHLEVVAELQDTRLTGLPDDAIAAPGGPLGPGASYFLNTHQTTQGEPFIRLGFATLRRGGFAATLGRFEYRDGLETVPADATLATLKRTRIAERLVGPFEFTHVGRTFDGGRLVYDQPWWNVTALGVRTSQGGFEISANPEVDDVWLAGLALTLKRLPFALPFDARLFYLYYSDERPDLPPPAPQDGGIEIHTIGAHALTAFDAGPGVVDVLGWGVAQTGRWGRLDQSAWAYALEAGYQLPRLPAAPWLRAGIDRSSGDDDPDDRTHGTFFQLLPTARTYAEFPFFNLMNLQDVFASLLLRPHERVTLRTNYHWLRLTESADAWWSGGGAQKDDLFGFAAQIGGGHDLAHLVDLSATITVTPWMTIGAYYGHAFGGDVVAANFDGSEADYGFIETTLRY
jgi:hypothetical protein